MTEITDWLRANSHGFSRLSDAEVNLISDFALLWGIFESRLLNTYGSAKAICSLVDAWERDGALNDLEIDEERSYFRQRYFENGAFTEHFEHLHLRSNDERELVRAVLSGAVEARRDSITVVLIIIFRYRNNLFHGVKWQYFLAGQLENFTVANSILMKILGRYGGLQEG